MSKWTVKPHQRELLADRIMQLDAEAQERSAESTSCPTAKAPSAGPEPRAEAAVATDPHRIDRDPRVGPAGDRFRAAARATNTAEAAARVTMFDEPSDKNIGVRVIHPQADVSATVASTLAIAAGYSADVVSGATPATFDVVSEATKFSDTRHLVHGSLGFEQSDGGIAGAVAYGWESDYKSFVLSGNTHHDLYEHNFTLALAYSHNWDTVCDADNTAAAGQPLDLVPLTPSAGCFTNTPSYTTHPLSIDTFEPSLAWTMTPRLVVQGGATIQILDGFQSNPYRKVAVGSRTARRRNTCPSSASATRCSPGCRTRSPSCAARPTRWCAAMTTAGPPRHHRRPRRDQDIGQSMLASLRAHYHLQGGAASTATPTSTACWDPRASFGPATASCRRWGTTSWGESSRSSDDRSRKERPGSSRSSWAASTRY